MRFSFALPLLLAAGFAFAQEEPATAAAQEHPMTREEMLDAYKAHVSKTLGNISYKEGKTELPGGIATLDLPKGYRYLNASDARKVVVDLWGNPPDQATDLSGMIVPAGEDLTTPNSWAIVISFTEDGYISDKDADEIDYADLLSKLKEGDKQANEARKASGLGTLNLVGWAVTPRYDKQAKVLYWAKQLHAEDEEEDTVNYDVRVLGRRGVLSLNGVAGMSRVPDIEAATPAIVSMVQFNTGHRYADFNSATDKKSDYSLAGLVLGGAFAAKLAANAGIFAKLGAILLAAKKLVIVGVLAVVAFVKRLFGRKGEA